MKQQLDLFMKSEVLHQVPNGSGGVTTVRWVPEMLAETGYAKKRIEILNTIMKRRKRHNATNKIRSAEQEGIRNLAVADAEGSSAKGLVRYRFYYESMGGEILCFDTKPLPANVGDAMMLRYNGRAVRPAWAVEGVVKEWIKPFDDEKLKYLTKRIPPFDGYGARLVQLPSQVPQSWAVRG